MKNEKLIFVSGKGGVGKSSVACALALSFAKENQKTLIIEVERPSSIASFFHKTKSDSFYKLTHNVDLKVMDPFISLKEYILRKIKIGFLYHVAFENRVFKIFLEAAPGIKELIVLGHIWYLAESNDYDRIIVDLPATGHGLAYLKVSKIVRGFVKAGPLHHIALEVDEMIKNAALVCVAIPQELAVSETVELVKMAEDELSLYPKLIVMNQFFKTPFDQTTSRDDNLDEALSYIQTLCHQSQNYLEELKLRLKMEPVVLPFIFSDTWGHEELDELSRTIYSK